MSSLQATEVGVMVAAGAWVVCAVLLFVSRERIPAILLLAAGTLLGSWVLLGEPWSSSPVAPVLAGQLLGPLAVLAYARSRSAGQLVDGAAAGALVVLAVVGLLTALGPGYNPYAAAGSLAVVVLHLWWRLEHLDAPSRRPLVWQVIGLGTAAALAFLVAFALPQVPRLEAVALAGLALPAICMVIGARRPDLVDATAIVVEATVLGVTGLTVLSLYVTGSSLLTVATRTDPPVGIQAMLAVAVSAAFHPVRRGLHGTVDELLLGRRPDPLTAVAQVAGNALGDISTLLTRIREALVLPYAAIREAPGAPDVAASGGPVERVRSFPTRPGEQQGADAAAEEVLVVGLRPGELQLSRVDLEVLGLVAPLLGQIKRAEALALQLSESRTAIRTAVEEERRRLRRELHDGLGPTLTGIALTADAAANLAGSDPEQVQELLARLRTETTGAIEDVRRIVYGIRPPALDQLGLRGALSQTATALARPGITIFVEAPAPLGELPAALEVAAYRIVTEAMTNAVRHGSPTRVVVTLERTPAELRVAITDDGRAGSGSSPVSSWSAGVGLTSMRERAEELGGLLRFGQTATGGCVEALLPLEAPVAGAPHPLGARKRVDAGR